MFRLLVVLTLLSCAYGFPKGKQEDIENNDGNEKIVGGQETTIEKHPYQVSVIKSDGQHSSVCGGSIIGERWVLTAAHCMKNAKVITIRAGSTYYKKGGVVYISRVFKVHPNYNRSMSLDYDVAVVQTPRNIVLNNSTTKIVTLAAAGSTVAKGTMVTVSGWGKTAPDGKSSKTLREVTVPIVDRETCNKIYKNKAEITPRMLCAGFEEGGKDKCQGDSGGPLILENGTQIGTVSFGIKCGTHKYPGVYCSVAAVRDWIKQVTGI